VTTAAFLPHDIDAEAAVLGSILYDPTTLSLVSWLRPEELYSEANRRIYEAALWLGGKGRSCDVVSVAGALQDTDRLAQVGGTAALANLADKTPASADIEAYATRIRELYQRRQLIRRCGETAARGHDGKVPTTELLSEHEQAIYELARDDRARQSVALGPIIYQVFNEVTEASKSNKAITGIPTGFERLDGMTAGLHDGELTIIASRPGMGKTSLVLNVVRNVASIVEEGGYTRGVIVFSLEMPREHLASRWVCGEARVDAFKLRRPGALNDCDWDRLAQAAQDLFQLPIEVDDTPAIGLVEIAGKCRRVDAKWEKEGRRLSLVVIDYLQLARGDQSGNREQEISSLSRGCKELAKRMRVPVMALSQLNRAVETRGGKDKRPQLSDLRESGAIEQDADNIVFIYRDDYYDKKTERKGIAELIVAKQRNGPTGKVCVRFDANHTRFDNLAPGEGPRDDAA
jgi:replicative DNA helicase